MPSSMGLQRSETVSKITAAAFVALALSATAPVALAASSGGPATISWFAPGNWGAYVTFSDGGWCEVDLYGQYAPVAEGGASEIANLSIWDRPPKTPVTYWWTAGAAAGVAGWTVCTLFSAD